MLLLKTMHITIGISALLLTAYPYSCLTDWKKFMCIKVTLIVCAVLGSFMGPAYNHDAMAGVWAVVGEVLGLLAGAILVSGVWCAMSCCNCKGQRHD